MVRRFVRAAMECAEDAARAAASVLGGSTGIQPMNPAPQMPAAAAAVSLGMPMGGPEPVSGPRKWLRSATSIFSMRGNTSSGIKVEPKPLPPAKKKLDGPVPLSEFAKRSKTSGPDSTGVHHTHTGHGRRDQLSAGERTRILRMLRDEGGRMADEDSRVYIGAAPGGKAYDFDFDDDSPAPAPAAIQRPDVPAKPAVVVGIAAAQAKARREKRQTAGPPSRSMPAQSGPISKSMTSAEPPLHLPVTGESPVKGAPMHLDASLESLESDGFAGARSAAERRGESIDGESKSMTAPRQAPMSQPPPLFAPPRADKKKATMPPPSAGPPPSGSIRRPPVPPAFNDEATREVDEKLLSSLRDKLPPKIGAKSPGTANHFDEPTRMASIDPRAAFDESDQAGMTENDEATRMANIDSLAAMSRKPPPPSTQSKKKTPLPKPSKNPPAKEGVDERTRAVDIRNDKSISDIDWDLE
jgi:hypothetical protein